MKRPARIFLLCFVIVVGPARWLMAAPDVSPAVLDAVDNASENSTIEVLISFENDTDYAAMKADRPERRLTRKENYIDIMNRLIRDRETLEIAVEPQLQGLVNAGDIESYRFFTVSKTLLVRVASDKIDALLELPGACTVLLNDAVTLIEPVEEYDYDAEVNFKTTTSSPALDLLGVRSLWERGLTGKGRLICSFDTGIDGDHPDLASKWRGNNGGSVQESWYAPHGSTVPQDNAGHGTHVMGSMVASSLADTLGVCPDAQWISAAVIDQGVSFSTTIADILSAFDWAINPDGNINTMDDVPDVICNSWGVPRGIYSDCDQTFWNAIDNVEAAGIVTVFAAGNEGPDSRTMRNPADRASSPVNSLSVGAIDAATNLVASFSSRGPASCDGVTIKPELVAPGVGVYSTYKDGTYKYMSGTSMAAPFIAGLAALLRQYNPDATVTEIKQALLSATRDLGPAGEDNSYGRGLVDAAELLKYMPVPNLPHITVFSHNIMAGGDEFADPGESADLTLTLNEPTGLVDSVDVYIASVSNWVDVQPDTIRFHFPGEITYSVGATPFSCTISPEAPSGAPAELVVHFRFLRGLGEDSTAHSFTIGHPLPGRIFDIGEGAFKFSASDFGQFGFGQRSIYPAGGLGMVFGASTNLLYESGIIIGRNVLFVSDAIRDEQGRFKESDFEPLGGQMSLAAVHFDESLTSTYSDAKADLPIPIEVEQSVYSSQEDYSIVQFVVINPTPERLSQLSIGLFCDIDIDRSTDRIGFDTLMGMIYQYNSESGIYLGIAGVSANE
ncbi:MAG: S8 family serine peptidase, partial [Candidatus Thorarchaeota archaeon]